MAPSHFSEACAAQMQVGPEHKLRLKSKHCAPSPEHDACRRAQPHTWSHSLLRFLGREQRVQQKWTRLCPQWRAVWGKRQQEDWVQRSQGNWSKDHTSKAEQHQGWLESWPAYLCFVTNTFTHWRKRTGRAALLNISFHCCPRLGILQIFVSLVCHLFPCS